MRISAIVLQIGIDHHRNQLLKAGFWLPSKRLTSPGRIPTEIVDFRWADEHSIDANIIFIIQIDVLKCDLKKIFDGMTDTRSNNKILWSVSLQHHPHSQ